MWLLDNDALPIETAYEFFKSYSEQTKECPVLSFEEFVDKSLECTKSGMHCICEYKSKKFLTEPGNLETIITDGEIIEVEVKQELKQIIIECSRNTNMPSLLGHTEKDLEK